MKKMIIIGAGISGILAKEYFRKRYDVRIFDAADSKTNPFDNHKAVLRLKTSRVGHILGTPVDEISVRKEIFYDKKTYHKSNIKLSNLYSIKTNGGITSRSIDGVDEKISKRYSIKDYCADDVESGKKLINLYHNRAIINEEIIPYDVCISTIPLPQVLNIIMPDFSLKIFESYPIYVKILKINISCGEIYQTIYYPGSETDCYRASLECNKVKIESVNEITHNDEEYVLSAFGIPISRTEIISDTIQKYGKILEISPTKRKSLLLYLTKNYSVYSLGRFATWRNIKIDDVIDDLDKIDVMIKSDDYVNEYEERLNK